MSLHHHHYQHLYRAEQEEARYEREHMFEKPLTPSDVGKLNRLVIPKQHAEKYFPLGGDSGDKGLLLSFEDESGKTWQFRYSYWTSSQSYVLTKGWSRFVKEKRLDAGDVVLFERPRLGGDRLYIGCRHRGGNDSPSPAQATTMPAAAGPWSPVYYAATCSYPTSSSCFSSVQQDCLLHAGNNTSYGSVSSCLVKMTRDSKLSQPAGDQRNEAIQSETEAPTTSKRLRLFGVDLDYQPEPRPDPMTSISWF